MGFILSKNPFSWNKIRVVVPVDLVLKMSKHPNVGKTTAICRQGVYHINDGLCSLLNGHQGPHKFLVSRN